MANQNFRVKHGLEVGGVEIADSSGNINTSSFAVSGATAGTYGNATHIPIITVTNKGIVTNAQSGALNGLTTNYTYNTGTRVHSIVTNGGTFAQTMPLANSTIAGVSLVADGLSTNATGHLSVDVGNNQLVSNSSGLFVTEGNLDIHNLSGYVANENIDHSSVSISSGNGLSGGGDITASRTLTVQGNNGTTVNSSGVFVRQGTGTVVNATGVHIGQSVGTTDDVSFRDVTVSGNLTVSGTQSALNVTDLTVNDAIITLASGQTGTPSLDAGLEVERGDSANALFYWDESTDRWVHKLAGGTEYKIHTEANDVALGTDTSGNYVAGATAANGISVSGSAGEGWSPTIGVTTGGTLVVNSTGMHVNNASLALANLSDYDANDHIDHSTVSVTAGNGLSGGGTIAATRTLTVKGNTGITVSSDGVFSNDSEIDHDSLSNFVANEHIDHSTVSMTAGNGLTGGGTIAATRTIAVEANTGITANSDGLFTKDSEIVHDNLSGFVGDEHINHGSVSITAGSGLTGGGNITASRTIAVNANNGLIANADGIFVKANTGIVANSSGIFAGSGGIIHDDLSGFVANEHIDHSGVSITAGVGLTGGGDITTSRSVAVLANTGIVANSTGLHTNDAAIVHDDLSGFVANEHIDHSSVSVNAGNGLTGGGTIAADRTLTVVGNTGITVSSDGVFTNDSEIDIHSLSGYVANEHINHGSVSITAGNGLSGGGDITASRSLAVKANNGTVSNSSGIFVKAGTGITVNATGVHLPQALGTSDNVEFNDLTVSGNLTVSGATVTIDATNLTVNDDIIVLNSGLSSGSAPSADVGIRVNRGSAANAVLYWDESTDRWTHKLNGGSEYAFHTKANDIALGTDTSGNYVATITAGNGITGSSSAEGGTPTIAVAAGNSQVVSNSSGVFVAESNIDIHNLSGYVANENIDHSSVSVTAGNGLTGGGTIAATRTLTVQANNGVVANSTGVWVKAGTGTTVNSTGVHIGQSVGTSDDVTFDNVDVDGDLRDSSNRVFKVYNASGTVVWG